MIRVSGLEEQEVGTDMRIDYYTREATNYGSVWGAIYEDSGSRSTKIAIRVHNRMQHDDFDVLVFTDTKQYWIEKNASAGYITTDIIRYIDKFMKRNGFHNYKEDTQRDNSCLTWA
jgi:hypothetical protein